ncbi:MAG: polyamine aminopropyltransferase, partial [Methyloglobulus sp.]
ACLSENGLLVQQSESPLLHLELIKAMRHAMSAAGFAELQTLYFPQCIYPSGWWSATIAGKASLNGFREQDSANKPFDTLYYNVDIHKGALAQPEFVKKIFNI